MINISKCLWNLFQPSEMATKKKKRARFSAPQCYLVMFVEKLNRMNCWGIPLSFLNFLYLWCFHVFCVSSTLYIWFCRTWESQETFVCSMMAALIIRALVCCCWVFVLIWWISTLVCHDFKAPQSCLQWFLWTLCWLTCLWSDVWSAGSFYLKWGGN